MSYASTQPVGGRVRFPPPPSSRGSEFLTPTRQGGSRLNSPFRTALRNSTQFEPESNANPFTPRLERGVSPASSYHALSRRNTTIGMTGGTTLSRGGRSNLYQPDMLDNAGSTRTSFTSDTTHSEYDMLRGVGGWPVDAAASESGYAASSKANRASTASEGSITGDFSAPTPFARPKSPAPRPASPRQISKKLPSFLLGSMQQSKSPARGSSFQADSAAASVAQPQAPQVTPPGISPRASRRLSGFGSNDMLSSAYGSAANTRAAQKPGLASTMDDAPPIMTLDDLDIDQSNVFSSNGTSDASASALDMDVFTTQRTVHGIPEPLQRRSGNHIHGDEDEGDVFGDDQDYSDVNIRSVSVFGLLPETESDVLNYFRGFGDILAFAVVSSRNSTLALLYSEPWQAQRAIAQGGSGGRILMGNRMVVGIDWATEECVELLFRQVFPERKLPPSAAPLKNKPATFSESIYAQSPQAARKRSSMASTLPLGTGAYVDRVREMGGGGAGAAGGSPFRHRQQQQSTRDNAARAPAASAGAVRNGSSVMLASSSTPKARNGIIQSALDILFGW
ncbi:hypothetical protein GGI12_000690 [Dipsacomyces acuminosporus]|nr:hypothetical protein GGI12_000690 [Dipsacomyces acuminosporus]